MVDQKIPVPSFIGGVSQQSPEFRLATQLGDGTKNIIGTVTEGITKRPPMRHEGVLVGGSNFEGGAAAKFAVINRDDDEKYLLAARDREIRVWNMILPGRRSADVNDIQFKDNTSPTPANLDYGASGDCDYLTTSDPARDLRFLSLADHTIVLNRSIKPVMKAGLTPAQKPIAIIEIPDAKYGMTYNWSVTWNDGTAKSRNFTYTPYSSDGTHRSTAPTSAVFWQNANHSISAKEITAMCLHALGSNDFSDTALSGKTQLYTRSGATPIDANGGRLLGSGTPGSGGDLLTGASWDIVSVENFIIIRNLDGDDFNIQITSPATQNEQKITKDSVQIFSELPRVCFDNTVIEVKGDEDDVSSAYYKFQSKSVGTTDRGEWVESLPPGIKYEMDEATLPHLVIRMADGNFQFTPVDGHTYSSSGTDFTVPNWGDRLVGDETTNPDPPFINKNIQEIFFWKNRLGMLVDDQVVLSEAGEYFNFFRTTIPQLLDSARVFVGSGEHRGASLEHAVPFADHLVIFGESRQFVLRGADAITPTSLSVAEAAGLDILPGITPISLGSTVMAGIPHGDGYSGVAEIHDIGTAERPRLKGIELTKVAPKMIPEKLLHMTGSTSENMIAVLPDLYDPGYNYATGSFYWLFNWFDNGDERVQAAWWPLSTQTLIIPRHLEFIQDQLWILGDVTHDLQHTPGNRLNLYSVDIGSLNQNTLALDEFIESGDLVAEVSNPATDKLELTLPFEIDDLIHPGKFKVIDEKGVEREIVDWRVGGNAKRINLKGQTTLSSGTRLGTTYDSWAELTVPVPRDRNGQTAPSRVAAIQNLDILLADATTVDVVVLPKVDWSNKPIGVPNRANEHRAKWDTQQIGQFVPLDGIPRKDGHFRTFIGEATDNAYILLENNTAFNFRCLNGSWDVKYHSRHR